MNLYNRKSLITAAPEGKPAKSHNSSITQWLYFIVVILLVGYLVYLLIKPYFLLDTTGLVDIEAREVLAERDGVLQQLYVSNAQDFKKGEILAIFAPEKRCSTEPDSLLEKLSFDIQVLNNEVEALQQEKARLSAMSSAVPGIQRALEINASLFKQQQKELQDQQIALSKLNIDIEREQEKLVILTRRYNNLMTAKQAQPAAEACVEKPVFAAEDGQVTDIRVLSQAFVAKGQPIIKYTPFNAQVRVVFLADKALYRSFAQHTQFVVTFPDGTESLGRVERIESVASKVGGNLNDLLAQDTVSLRMILVPVDPEHTALWRTFERIPVSVRGLR